jgi:prepilin-type N-terminal cleavage/methylation domain-containing protein
MNGFTLLEIIITVSILVIVTTVLAVAWPRVREQQALLLAKQTMQALFRDAQQQALNEERSAACLERSGGAPPAQRRCSDIGIVIKNATVHVFADTAGQDNRFSDEDLILNTQELPLGVRGVGSEQSFLFKATPPRLFVFVNGQFVSPATPGSLVLQSGRHQEHYRVQPYGQIE